MPSHRYTRWFSLLLAIAAALGLTRLGLSEEPEKRDAVDRMRMDRLKVVDEQIAALADKLQPVELDDGYDDVRALLHVHSHFSHDSNGSLKEIVAAAKATGVRVIMFTEHPADHYDYVDDGHRGDEQGVLLIPGAETRGFLAFPTRSIQSIDPGGPQEFVNLVLRDGGLVFLSHLEARMDWEISGMTGNEIYNTHADVMEEKRLLARMRSPLGLLGMMSALEAYPQELFGALLDYPADYLRRWDELCQQAPHTGVAANDAHHNQGIRAVLEESGKVRVENLLGEKITELDAERAGFLKSRLEGKEPGDVVLTIDLDPYERGFRHVSTHLLMNEVSPDAVWIALREGRAYVGFDWLADPTGFAFIATRGDTMWTMGGRPAIKDGITLKAEAPLAGTMRLLRDGEVVHDVSDRQLKYDADEPGVYRVEVHLTIDDELRPWILSNPIYVRSGE